MRTESVLKAADHFGLSTSESPEFIGRAVTALAWDTGTLEKTGRVLIAAELAREYGLPLSHSVGEGV